MNRLQFPYLQQDHAQLVLRVALAAVFSSHGVTRLATGRVEPFGEFLDGAGFPLGIVWAWGVTLVEIIGAGLLLVNFQVRIVCVLFIVQMMFGIVLVHWANGWFVVGHGQNGMEYSFLLIASLLALFALKQPSIDR